jgi:hypothetical protein
MTYIPNDIANNDISSHMHALLVSKTCEVQIINTQMVLLKKLYQSRIAYHLSMLASNSWENWGLKESSY